MQYIVKKKKKETENGHNVWTSRIGEERVVFSEAWLILLSRSKLGEPDLGSLTGALRMMGGQHTYCPQDGNPLLSFRLRQGSAQILPSPTSLTWSKCSEGNFSPSVGALLAALSLLNANKEILWSLQRGQIFTFAWPNFWSLLSFYYNWSLISPTYSQQGYHLAGVVLQRNKGGNRRPVSSSNTRASYMPVTKFPISWGFSFPCL